MNKVLKAFLILFGILFTLAVGFFLFIHIAFDGIFTGPTYFKEDLIENFEERKIQIFDAKNYFESIVPKETYVELEFKNGQLGIFHIKKNGIYQSNWNLDIDSKKVDSLLKVLDWTKTELKTLKSKLDEANCISAASGNPLTIGWQRSGMGIYSYHIFDQNLNDSLIAEYNGGCTHIFYKENIVLGYGGGAIGPQCFPGIQKNEK